MRTASQIRAEMRGLIDKAEDLVLASDAAERRGETIRAAELSAQADSLMEKIGDSARPDKGRKATGLYAELERALVLEKRKDSPTMYATPKTTKKLKAFQSADDAYRCGLWLKATHFGDESAKRQLRDLGGVGFRNTQTEGTDSGGGYTVPDLLSSAIINAMESSGVAMQLCNVQPMRSDSLDIPKRSSGQTVYYPGEASAITASDKAYGQVALTAVKRAVLTKVSNELIQDSLINVMDDVASEAAHQLALRQDLEFIQGDGSGTYGSVTGLISSCGAAGTHDLASTKTSFADITLSDLNTAMSLVADKFVDDSSMAWLMRRSTFYGVVVKLLASAGGNAVQDLQQTVRPLLFGYPVYFSDKMPADAVSTYGVFFGNFSQAAVLGLRQDAEVSVSRDYDFAADNSAVRVVSRYDIQVHESPGSGTSYGAYAGVKTAAS